MTKVFMSRNGRIACCRPAYPLRITETLDKIPFLKFWTSASGNMEQIYFFLILPTKHRKKP